jgi:Cytidylate kinase-like family
VIGIARATTECPESEAAMRTEQQVDAILTSVRSVLSRQRSQAAAGRPFARPEPFITISRQAGAGAHTLASMLVDRLNELGADARPWAAWDRAAIETVAADERIPAALLLSLEEESPWMEQFFDALPTNADPADLREFKAYRGVADTVRGLARAASAVIVGRGGVYATRDLPGGVHVRLVAPVDYRVARVAREQGVSPEAAEAKVRRLDRERAAFQRRYFGGDVPSPELFTLILNVADMTDEQMADAIVSLVLGRTAPNRAEEARLAPVAA